jgi:hypothetical protein
VALPYLYGGTAYSQMQINQNKAQALPGHPKDDKQHIRVESN